MNLQSLVDLVQSIAILAVMYYARPVINVVIHRTVTKDTDQEEIELEQMRKDAQE